LILHSGLRTCEVQRLKWSLVDFEHRAIRIEASKNLKSRVAPLTQPVLDALNALANSPLWVSDRVLNEARQAIDRLLLA
jgi:integrase